MMIASNISLPPYFPFINITLLSLKWSQWFMLLWYHRISQFSDWHFEPICRNTRKSQLAKFAFPPCKPQILLAHSIWPPKAVLQASHRRNFHLEALYPGYPQKSLINIFLFLQQTVPPPFCSFPDFSDVT